MLIFKTKKKLLLGVNLFLMAVHSLNTVFLSFVLGNMITAVTAQSLEVFRRYVMIGIAGFLFFMAVGIVMVRLKARLIQTLNLQIKQVMIQDSFYQNNMNQNDTEALSVMTNNLKQLETKGIEAELAMLNLSFTYVFALLAALRYDFWISFAFLLGSCVPLAVSLLFQKRIAQTSLKWSGANALYTHRLKDYLGGMETIKTYQIEDEIIGQVYEDAGRMENALRLMNVNVETMNQLVYMTVMIFGLLIPFGIGVLRVMIHGVALAAFISIVQLSNSLRTPLLQMMNFYNAYATSKPIKNRYLEADKRIHKLESFDAEAFESIELSNVSFHYDQTELFEKLNLTIHKGDKILIIGPSGSGKSSLLRLIQKRLPISAGAYRYNGKVSSDNLDSIFSLIRQQVLIFDDTLLYNITLGKDYPQEAIDEAIRLAKLEDVVSEKGLNYRVGENGQHLSMGQAQRIEIARALIRKRPILLADELTSAQDYKMAQEIRKSLFQSAETFIEVSHKIPEDDKQKYTQIWNLETMG